MIAPQPERRTYSETREEIILHQPRAVEVLEHDLPEPDQMHSIFHITCVQLSGEFSYCTSIPEEQ